MKFSTPLLLALPALSLAQTITSTSATTTITTTYNLTSLFTISPLPSTGGPVTYTLGSAIWTTNITTGTGGVVPTYTGAGLPTPSPYTGGAARSLARGAAAAGAAAVALMFAC